MCTHTYTHEQTHMHAWSIYECTQLILFCWRTLNNTGEDKDKL
jgi:hypothetical protein